MPTCRNEARFGLLFFLVHVKDMRHTNRPKERSRSDHVREFPTPAPPQVPTSDSSPLLGHVPTSTLPNNVGPDLPDPTHKTLIDHRKCNTTISTSPSPIIPASPPAPPDKLLSDLKHELCTDGQQCISATSTPSSSGQEYIPVSQFSRPCFLTSPDKLHPTLSCWIKNMDKLFGLVYRLRELASSAPPQYRSQLLRQVAALRAMSKKQKEHFIEFLQLGEEYANKYLLGISAEIQQQSSFLDKLEGRLEAAKKLHGEVVDLQRLYESRTVAAMENLRASGKEAPFHLQRKNIETFDFYQYRGRFRRTKPCSTRSTCY